jgi:hypothetical protein
MDFHCVLEPGDLTFCIPNVSHICNENKTINKDKLSEKYGMKIQAISLHVKYTSSCLV